MTTIYKMLYRYFLVGILLSVLAEFFPPVFGVMEMPECNMSWLQYGGRIDSEVHIY